MDGWRRRPMLRESRAQSIVLESGEASIGHQNPRDHVVSTCDLIYSDTPDPATSAAEVLSILRHSTSTRDLTRFHMQQTELASITERLLEQQREDLDTPGPEVNVQACSCAFDLVRNGQIRTLGPRPYTMTRDVTQRKMTNKYCSQGEIQEAGY
ncbi:hypothetical protein Tco_0367205 [Tanacetum coccineum]